MNDQQVERISRRNELAKKRGKRCHLLQTRTRSYGHLIMAIGYLCQMTAGSKWLCNGEIWTVVSLGLAFNLIAACLYSIVVKNARKRQFSTMCEAVFLILFDGVLLGFVIWNWIAQFTQSCHGKPYHAPYQVMFYMNIIGTVLLAQSACILIILQASRLLLLITCCQYRSFHDTMVHSLLYFNSEAPCKNNHSRTNEQQPQESHALMAQRNPIETHVPITISQVQLLRHLPSKKLTDVGMNQQTVCNLCQTIINHATPGTDSEFIVTLPCKDKHTFHEVCMA